MKRTSIILSLLIVGSLGMLVQNAYGLRLQSTREVLSADVLATGLVSPTGMACDPKTERLYVTERDANRVSLIHEHAGIPVLTDQFRVSDTLPHRLISHEHPRKSWTEAAFRKPIDLAFDSIGGLYVAESGAGGRVLRFEPMYDGLLSASVIPTPWSGSDYSYTSIAVDNDYSVYLTARERKMPMLAFGSAFVRNQDGGWLLIDYGPFAEFSNIAINPHDHHIAVAETRRGNLSWYETDRQAEMAMLGRLDGVRHLAILPNGKTLATLARTDNTWSIVEVDPISGDIREWVGELPPIGGLYANPRTGEVYLSLVNEGKIIRITRIEKDRDADQNDSQLVKLAESFEIEKALPPEEWPSFFRDFVETLDVIQPINPGDNGSDPTGTASTSGKAGMSMDDFAAAIPVVAAKAKAHLLSPASLEPDPIKEIDFLLFYPNQSSVAEQTVAPSISLFHARHKSGRTDSTHFMPNEQGKPLSEDLEPENIPEVLVSFPSGYYAELNDISNRDLVRAYFLGMGLGPDYWIDINREHLEKSRLMVEKPDGTKIYYRLEPYRESIRAGGYSVLVAGTKAVKAGWASLNTSPAAWSYVDPDTSPVATKHAYRMGTSQQIAQQDEMPSTAAAYNKLISPRELNLRRKIVMRAAARWGEAHQ